jgi:hypothetical protein
MLEFDSSKMLFSLFNPNTPSIPILSYTRICYSRRSLSSLRSTRPKRQMYRTTHYLLEKL